MLRRTLVIAMATALVAASAYAQQTPAVAAKQEKPALKPAVPEGLPNNIRIELTITDQAGPGEPGKRTVSMIVADRKNGSVRSSGRIVTPRQTTPVALNVDAVPTIIKDGLMRLEVTLEYVPKPGSDNGGSGEGGGSINQRLTLLVESGKPLTVSQASDPTSDRKISVELTATILK